MVYTINFAVLAFAALVFDVFPDRNMKKLSGFMYAALIAYLILFAGLRKDTGYDFASYRAVFQNIQDARESFGAMKAMSSNMEIGYLFLNYLFKGMGYQVFVFAFAALSILPKAFYIEKCCQKKFIALFCYYASIYINFDMGVMRQGIAFGIVLWAYVSLADKDYRKFYALVAFACIFHVSAAVILLLRLFGNRRFQAWQYSVGLAACFGISMLHPVMRLAQMVPAGSRGFLVDKLVYYALYYSEEASIYKSVLKRVILFIIFFIAANYGKKAAEAAKVQFYLNAFYFSILFSLLAADVPIVAGRASLYFTVAQIYLFSYLAGNGHRMQQMGKANAVIRRAAVSVLVGALSYNSMRNVVINEEYVPYRSVVGDSMEMLGLRDDGYGGFS